MAVINQEKQINDIRDMITIAKNNVKSGYDKYTEFDKVYDYTQAYISIVRLEKNILDKLWKEMQEITI